MNSIGLNPRRRAAYKSLTGLVCICLLVAFTGSTRAATLTITATEDNGGNVLLTGSGSFDTSGNDGFRTNTQATSGSTASRWGVVENTSDPRFLFETNGTTVIWNAMSSTAFEFNKRTDDPTFQISDYASVNLPAGTSTSENVTVPLDFVWTVTDKTIDGLSLNFGTIFKSDNNLVTLVDGRLSSPSPVPLPAAAPLLLGALGGFGLLSRRRKQRSTSAAA